MSRERTCDFCGNTNEEQFIYGRWIIYCEQCADKGGKQKDFDHFWENECANGQRLDGLDGEASEMILNHCG